jgi:nucleoside-diphosphate-sugar epimerase
MRVLVTGGCGYKGARLVPALLDQGHEVTVVDLNWFNHRLSPHPALTVKKSDFGALTCSDLMGVDTVIHLASVANDPSGDLSAKLTWETNVLSTDLLCQAMIEAKVPRLIFASSGSVYGVSDLNRVTETAPLFPISDYNKTKMIGERVILSYGDQLQAQILRPATVCGVSPRQRLDVVVNLLTFQAVTTGELLVLGGAQSRPNIHIDDMIAAYLFLLERRDLEGIFNAGFENMTVLEIAEMVAKATGASLSIKESSDPRSYKLDSTKLKAAGFIPQKTVQDAIDEIAAKVSNADFNASVYNYNVKTMIEIFGAQI